MDSKIRFFICLVIGVSLILMTAAIALGAERDHEDGFFLRLSGGFGSASTETELGSETWKMDGVGSDVNIAIGGMVRPNLALHGTLFGWMTTDPEMSIGSVSGTIDADIIVSAFGGGATYYFMPANAYVSASLGFGTLTFVLVGVCIYSDYGPVVDVTVGKEWWVGDNWALGVAGGLIYHSLPDEDLLEDNWTGMSYALRFTATRN